jgi:DNA-binding transcriptional LysR family regulator
MAAWRRDVYGQLKQLEDELGTPLFERLPRGGRLLPQGALFLEHARQILAAVDGALISLKRHAAQAGPGDRLPGDGPSGASAAR